MSLCWIGRLPKGILGHLGPQSVEKRFGRRICSIFVGRQSKLDFFSVTADRPTPILTGVGGADVGNGYVHRRHDPSRLSGHCRWIEHEDRRYKDQRCHERYDPQRSLLAGCNLTDRFLAHDDSLVLPSSGHRPTTRRGRRRSRVRRSDRLSDTGMCALLFAIQAGAHTSLGRRRLRAAYLRFNQAMLFPLDWQIAPSREPIKASMSRWACAVRRHNGVPTWWYRGLQEPEYRQQRRTMA